MADTSETLVIGGDVADLMAKLKMLESQLKKTEGGVASVGKAGKAMGGNAMFGFLEAMRGAEDFMSQIQNGVGPAMRATSNNISSMATLIGGPLVGALATGAAVLGAQFIPKLFATKEEASEAANRVKIVDDRILDLSKSIAKFRGTEGAMKDKAEEAANTAALEASEGEVDEKARNRNKALKKLKDFDRNFSEQALLSGSGGRMDEDEEQKAARIAIEKEVFSADAELQTAKAKQSSLVSKIHQDRGLARFDAMKTRIKEPAKGFMDLWNNDAKSQPGFVESGFMGKKESADNALKQFGIDHPGKLTDAQKKQQEGLEVVRDKAGLEADKLKNAREQELKTLNSIKNGIDALVGAIAGGGAKIAGTVIPALNRNASQ